MRLSLRSTIDATPTISIVPQFRMLVVKRGAVREIRSSFAHLGVPRVVYRFGVGVRVTF
jgi:hypothetical protein